MFSWNIKGQLTEFSAPWIMGIINATPDSFVEGHSLVGISGMVDIAGRMLEAGADLVDIGGQSTRPGSTRISATEERDRVVPVVEAIRAAFPSLRISIDTYQAEVAEAAVLAGADMVNDISGGQYDENLWPTVARLGVPYILMHAPKLAAEMHTAPVDADLILEQTMAYFRHRIHEARAAGIVDLAIDPGFGFGKTPAANFRLLHELTAFHRLEVPVLAGLSRKRMIWQTINGTPETSLNGSTALHMIALERGAHILRVHDVREAWEARELWLAVHQKNREPR